MPNLLTTEELRSELKMEYQSRKTNAEAREKRLFNINNFMKIDRVGLNRMKHERQLLLYSTQKGEKIYIQYPGQESLEKIAMPFDFRPELQLPDGTYMQDASFGFIWDILDSIGREHKKELSFVSSLFIWMGYMHNYCKEKQLCPIKQIYFSDNGNVSEVPDGEEELEWYKLDIDDNVWFTLNDRIGGISVSDEQKISFEAFIKFVDLLFQNEDCKYYYKNVVVEGKENYKLGNGRTKSCMANLQILNYFQENEKLSVLLDMFQKSRGVPSFRVRDYEVVSDGMVFEVRNR